MKQQARSFNKMTAEDNGSGYRFGYNGKEQDFSFHNADGQIYDFGARMYDVRLGRFMSLDPEAKVYPFMSPYCFAANNPISFIDENGKGSKNGPFSAYKRGNFFSVGYQTSSQRGEENVERKLSFALTGPVGMVADLTEGVYKGYTSANNESSSDPLLAVRDVSKETNEWLFKDFELPKISKAIGILGHVFTAYDIYNEVTSQSRDEVLKTLTAYVAQVELGAIESPSSTSNYLDFPISQFKDAEQVSNILNSIFNELNTKVFKYVDLTTADGEKLARETLDRVYNSTKFTNITKSINEQSKPDVSNDQCNDECNDEK
jgi:RHS repeat-associated protein